MDRSINSSPNNRIKAFAFFSRTDIIARVQFDESLTWLAVAGLLVTAAGVALVTRSSQVSNPPTS